MYPMYAHCVFNLNPRACSIDTPLHTFVPFRHVDHLHPNAVIAVAASVEPGEADPRDLRRRRDLRALAAAGLRHRAPDRAADRGAPEGAGRAARPPRHELLERRRQDLLRDGARDRRPRRALHREPRQGREDVRRDGSTRRSRRPSGGASRRQSSRGSAAASRRPGASWAPCRTTSGCCAS